MSAVAVTTTTTTIDAELERVRALREEGATWKEIGMRENLTAREASNRYEKRLGLTEQSVPAAPAAPVRESKTKNKNKNTAQKRARASEIRELSEVVTRWLGTFGPVTRAEVLKEFDITVNTYAILDIPRHLIISPSRRAAAHWTDEQVFRTLRRAAAESGVDSDDDEGGKVLSTARYAAWYGEQEPGTAISLPGILVKYGTWNEACEKAGVRHGKAHRTYARNWTEDQVLTAIARYVDMCVAENKKVTYTGYDIEQRRHGNWPSGSSVRNVTRRSWVALVQESAGY